MKMKIPPQGNPHANELQNTQIASTIHRMQRNEVTNPLANSPEASNGRERVRPRPTGASSNPQGRKRDESLDNEIEVDVERTARPLGHPRVQFSAQLDETHALIPALPTPTLRKKGPNAAKE